MRSLTQATGAAERVRAPVEPDRAWLVEAVLALPVLAALAAVLIRQVALLDSDYYWHLATGQLMLRAGYPSVDPFTWTYAGAVWRPQDWLTDLAMALLYAGFGDTGPAVAAVLVGLATWMITYLRARLLGAGRLAALALVLVGGLALASLVAIRPLMLLWLGLSLAALLVERVLMTGQRWPLVALPLVAAAWVNLHRGAPPVMAGLAGLGAVHLLVVWAWAAWRREAPSVAKLWRAGALLLTAGLVLAAGALTPNGVDGLVRSLLIVNDPAVRTLIQEWQSPDFHRADLRPFEVLLLGGLVIFGRWGPRRPDLWPYAALIVLGTAVAALEATRHMALFCLLAGPWIAAAPPAPEPVRARLKPAVGALLGLVALVLVVVSAPLLSGPALASRQAAAFPRAAVDWLQARGDPGRLVHEYDWGGYLMWRGVPVFIDGRLEMLYDRRFTFRTQAVLTAALGWRDLILRDYPADGALLRPDAPLVEALRAEGWVTCWQDTIAVVLRPSCRG